MGAEGHHGVRQPCLYYGWIVVSVGIIGMTLVYGVRHSFTVFCLIFWVAAPRKGIRTRPGYL